jgi:hypothetical protein
MGPRACLDAVDKRKIPCPWRELNSGRPANSLVTTLTELFRLYLHMYYYYYVILVYSELLIGVQKNMKLPILR